MASSPTIVLVDDTAIVREVLTDLLLTEIVTPDMGSITNRGAPETDCRTTASRCYDSAATTMSGMAVSQQTPVAEYVLAQARQEHPESPWPYAFGLLEGMVDIALSALEEARRIVEDEVRARTPRSRHRGIVAAQGVGTRGQARSDRCAVSGNRTGLNVWAMEFDVGKVGVWSGSVGDSLGIGEAVELGE
jgi:hypothetical protein